MKILFISRAYPPVIGGIENQNHALSVWLGKNAEVKTLANTRGKNFLPFFVPWATLRALFLLRRYDVLLLGDGVLAPLGCFVSWFFPKKAIVSVIHGLDLTFAEKKSLLSRLYKAINLPALRSLDGIICVSQETRNVALSIGIQPERAFVIPNGVDPGYLRISATRNDLSHLLGEETQEKKVVVRIGRFVKHKGVEWFIRNVVPTLPENVLFVAAGGVASGKAPGDKNIFPACEKTVQELHLEKKVRLLKNVPWKDIQILLNTGDLAVAPNIRVPGSMEGFGISVIEAAICGLPIVVSRLEGLQEAVVDGENGFFVEPEDQQGYAKKIIELLNDDSARKAFGQKAALYTEEHFAWSVISLRYIELLEDFFKSARESH
ncbi:MAG: glycosyltransferase family 4 protein [Candidatus Moraniibacteriota bacterium]